MSNFTQDDLDALSAAFRLGYLQNRSEEEALGVMKAALMQRHADAEEEAFTAMADEALAAIKADRGTWLFGVDEGTEQPAVEAAD